MTFRRPQPHAPFATINCLAKAIGSGPTIGIEVGHAGYAPIFAKIDASHHTVVANFSPMAKSVRHVTDQCALLGSHLTALNTEAAIDAVLPVSMCARGDGHRPTDAHTDT